MIAVDLEKKIESEIDKDAGRQRKMTTPVASWPKVEHGGGDAYDENKPIKITHDLSSQARAKPNRRTGDERCKGKTNQRSDPAFQKQAPKRYWGKAKIGATGAREAEEVECDCLDKLVQEGSSG